MALTKVIVLGDSVAKGTEAKLDVFYDCFQYKSEVVNLVRPTQTWSSILERILSDWTEDEVKVINAGKKGNISTKAVNQLKNKLLLSSGDYVLVIFGTEDTLESTRPEAFKKNLEKIIGEITKQNAIPILFTSVPISERMTATGYTLYQVRQYQADLSRLANLARSIAKEKSLPLIDLNRYFLNNHLAYDHLYKGYLPDGVAQSGMASFIAGEILPILGVKNFPKITLNDYRKVYSDAENFLTRHNGFTDLTYFQGEFYVAFRTGAVHGFRGLFGGKTLVLRSKDSLNWVKDAELKVEDFVETRDPKFLRIDGRLMLYAICHKFSPRVTVSYGFEKLGEGRWSQPFECTPGVFWRPKKWGDKYMVANYGWVYNEKGERHFGVKLFQSSDGHIWKEISTILDYKTDANETDLFVDNGTLVAFSRAGRQSNEEMLISTYIPSKNQWETVSSGRIIQAPCVFKVKDKIMVSGRYCSQSDERFRELEKDWGIFNTGTPDEIDKVDPARIEEYHHGLRTGIFLMDGTRPRLVMELLSAGDSSYTGVVQYGDEYLISDYSMHEYYRPIHRPGDWNTPNDIYVSRVRFGE